MVDHLTLDRVDAHVQVLNGQAFIFGLAWYSAEDVKTKDRWRVARKFAQEREFDLFLTHKRQYATGLLEDHEAGAFSAAATLSAQFEDENILGLFALEEGRYWVFAKADEQIDGDGDAVFDDLDEALDHFYDLMDLDDFERILCSEELEGESFEHQTLSELLPGSTKPFVFSAQNQIGDALAIGLHYGRNLQDLAREKPRVAAGVAGLVLVPVLGLLVFSLVPEEPEPLIVAEPVLEITVDDLEEDEEVTLVSRPYEKRPTAAAFLALCQNRMRALVRTVEGWDMGNIYCTETRANLTYHKTAFASRGALEQRFRNTDMLISFGNRGDTGAVVNNTGRAEDRDAEVLWGFETVRSWAHDRAIKLGVELELKEIRSLRHSIVTEDEPNVTRVELPSLEFTLKARTTPKVWGVLLAIPGTLIDSANWTIEEGWQIEGRIYADEIDHI